MPDYKDMYFHLAAKVADTIDLLIKAQKECEENYINCEDSDEGGVANDN